MDNLRLISPNDSSEKIASDFLSEALKRNRCTIVLGPEISRLSSDISVENLLWKLLDRIDHLPSSFGNRDPIFSKLQIKRLIPVIRNNFDSKSKLFHYFRRQLSKNLSSPNELHKLLAQLKASFYIDTNYDDLFLDVLEATHAEENLSPIIFDHHLDYKNRIRYIKLNGGFDDFSSLVLPYESYEKRFQDNPYLANLLKSIFIQHVVLFLGFQADDPTVEDLILKLARKNEEKETNICIALNNPTEQEIVLYQSMQVNIVPLISEKDKNGGKPLEDFLIRIWQQATDFRIYLDVPQELPKPYSNKLVSAIEIYRRGEFKAAKEHFSLIEEDNNIGINIWRSDPGALAQYSYFYLKTFDKLNDWLGFKDKYKLIDSILNQTKDCVPEFMMNSLEALILSARGLAEIRALELDVALKTMTNSIEKLEKYEDLVSEREFLLHADRHVILAQLHIYKAYFKAENKHEELNAAQKLIEKSEILYRSNNAFDENKEVHYVGRYYGTKVFLEIAEVRTGKKDYKEVARAFDIWAKKSYTPERNRPPYGIVVGKYCEAISFFFKSQNENIEDQPDKLSLQAQAIEQLTKIVDNNNGSINLTNLVLAKLHRALELMHKKAGNKSEQKQNQKDFESALNDLITDNNILGNSSDQIATEDWIYLPLN